jgi:N-acyl-D-glutamate deacylase
MFNLKKISIASILLISASHASADYDIIIKNGRVIDPETRLDAVRNIAIKGGKIVKISKDALVGNKTIDAKNLIVSPGFIDLHSHSFELPGQRMQAFDGVTTALELESGVYPVGEWYDMQAKEGRVINYGTSVSWTFARIGTFVPEKKPIKATAEWYLDAFKYLQWQDNVGSEDQLQETLGTLEKGLNEGALAIGINAGYVPGVGGKEIIAVSELAARYNVATSTHIRDWSNVDPKSSLEGLNFMIGVAATTGVESIICHLNSSMLHDAAKARTMLEAARSKGITITTEAYPYGGGTFPIASSILTLPTQDFQQRIGANWNNVRLVATGRQIVDEEDIRAEQKNNPGQMVVLQYLDESNPKHQAILDESLTAPWIPIASDAVPWAYPDGSFVKGDIWPLPKEVSSNPRSAGTFAKFLGTYVRERKVFNWIDGLKKVTLLPAQSLEKSVAAMKHKGRLQVGADADITIFDPKTIKDRATVDYSAITSQGVRYVIVNGTTLIEDGKLLLDKKPGQAIRRATSL